MNRPGSLRFVPPERGTCSQWALAAVGVLGALVAPRMTPKASENAPSSTAEAPALSSDGVS